MKIYIGSDIHGSETYVKEFLTRIEEDEDCSGETKAILLGDIYNHGPRNPFPEGYAPMDVAESLNAVKDNIKVIKGNCDSEVDQMISEFEIESDFFVDWQDHKVFFTHGHKHNPELPYKSAREGDIVFYGHFHKPDLQIVEGVRYVCVGALGMCPEDSQRTYATLDENEVKVLTLDEAEEVFQFNI